jgi:hypothetical protein
LTDPCPSPRCGETGKSPKSRAISADDGVRQCEFRAGRRAARAKPLGCHVGIRLDFDLRQADSILHLIRRARTVTTAALAVTACDGNTPDHQTLGAAMKKRSERSFHEAGRWSIEGILGRVAGSNGLLRSLAGALDPGAIRKIPPRKACRLWYGVCIGIGIGMASFQIARYP